MEYQMSYEEKLAALIHDGGYTEAEAKALLIDLGENDDLPGYMADGSEV